MSERLRRFLIALVLDEQRTERFVREALDESDLTEEEKAVVLSRDPDRVRRALGAAPPAPTRVLNWFKKKAKKKRKSKRTSKRTSKRKTKGARYSASRRTRGTSKKRSRRAAPRRQR